MIIAVLGAGAIRGGARGWFASMMGARATGVTTVGGAALAHATPALPIHTEARATSVKVLRATLHPGRGAEGARVVLVNGSDQRVLPTLPVTVEVPAGEEYGLIATRRGYVSRQLQLAFEEGKDSKDFEISLEKAATSGTRSLTEAARSFATIDLRSTPWSTVILDGKAIGSCPRLGVVVTAGQHTVLFAGEVGQKRMTFSVRPGETKTVAVRL